MEVVIEKMVLKIEPNPQSYKVIWVNKLLNLLPNTS